MSEQVLLREGLEILVILVLCFYLTNLTYCTVHNAFDTEDSF